MVKNVCDHRVAAVTAIMGLLLVACTSQASYGAGGGAEKALQVGRDSNQLPTLPGGKLNVRQVVHYQCTLEWSSVPDRSDVILERLTAGAKWKTLTGALPSGVMSYTDSSVIPAAEYMYRLLLLDSVRRPIAIIGPVCARIPQVYSIRVMAASGDRVRIEIVRYEYGVGLVRCSHEYGGGDMVRACPVTAGEDCPVTYSTDTGNRETVNCSLRLRIASIGKGDFDFVQRICSSETGIGNDLPWMPDEPRGSCEPILKEYQASATEVICVDDSGSRTSFYYPDPDRLKKMCPEHKVASFLATPGEAEAAEILDLANRAWSYGAFDSAVVLYKRLQDGYSATKVYTLNRSRIAGRARG